MIQFFATTPKGMEEILAQELRELGASEVVHAKGGAIFKGDLKMAYRVCLWSRIANRVLYPIKRFSAPTPEKLYGAVKSVRWSEHLNPEKTLAVDFSTSHSQITHSQFGAQKVKDAICDQFKSNTGVRPSVDLHYPDVRVNLHLVNDEATLSIDLSGESLHRRGYREEGAHAPLKENLAAALLVFSEWKDTDFLDPMCGSGTLPIEAAMKLARIAPSLKRKYFGFQGWLQHEPKLWTELTEEAEQVQIRDFKNFPKISGYDQDAFAVRTAIANVERAGLRKAIHIEKRELKDARPTSEKGTIMMNPPYGERLGEEEELIPLYKEIGDTFKKQFKGWTGFVFTGNAELAKKVGLKATRRFVLFNGPIECRLLKYDLY